MNASVTPSLLWSLSSDHAPGTSYLMGTMHVRDRRAFKAWEDMTSVMTECAVFAAEVNLDELTEAIQPGAASAFFSAAPNLQDYLPGRRYERLRNMLIKGVGIDIRQFHYLPPIVLTQLIDERLLANDYPTSLDECLWNHAKAGGKQLVGLEHWSSQLELLQSIPYEEQTRLLLDIGRHLSRRRRQLNRVANLYEQSNLRQLYLSARHGSGRLRKVILLERNNIMAANIALLATQQPTFAAVGAAHLCGGKGVIRLLKRHGFKVQPVSPRHSFML